MSHLRVWSRAILWTALDHVGDAVSVLLMPRINQAIKEVIPEPDNPWAFASLLVRRTVDGAIIAGVSSKAGAKYAIPKGLPIDGARALAIENEPHEVNGFSGVIAEGYGKGTKTLLADETVVIKIGGKSSFSRMNYHFHNADAAGPHYDLAVRDVPPGTKEWELHIPRGPYKGRFAFRATDKGMIVVPMKDHGVVAPKPPYQLRSEEWLGTINPVDYDITRKLDGSLGNGRVTPNNRAAFRSHREGGETYYNRLPAIESLQNQSLFFTLRKLDPGPQLDVLFQGELVHKDGVSRTSGVLNSHPEKAQESQSKTGLVEYYAWDIIEYKGKSLANMPVSERRALMDQLIKKIRLYNKNWHTVERYTGDDPQAFYRRVINDKRGLPYSEGIVLKPIQSCPGDRWFKIKARDFEDLLVVSIDSSGPGTKYSNSAAVMLVEDPITGGRGEVGSFAISDAERRWIWDHRDELVGAVAKVSVQELTESGAPRAGVFHGWHPDPRYGKVGSEQALMMYAETTAGMDPTEGQRAVYAMKSAAGWRRG